MSRVSLRLRQTVIARAGSCCEYCLLDQRDIFFSFEVDHIIAEKHGGESLLDNLCLACPDCNAYKGSDIGSIDRETGLFTPLFNPRTQQWQEHFRLDGSTIIPLTSEGRVTVSMITVE